MKTFKSFLSENTAPKTKEAAAFLEEFGEDIISTYSHGQYHTGFKMHDLMTDEFDDFARRNGYNVGRNNGMRGQNGIHLVYTKSAAYADNHCSADVRGNVAYVEFDISQSRD